MNGRSPAAAPRPVRHRPQPAAGSASTPTLRIGIDRVTLYGFVGTDRRRFARSLEAKLAELAAAHRDHDWSAGARRRHICSLDAGELRAGASAEQAARQIATALFATLIGQGKGPHRV
jgi:hypothetical protein